MHWFFIALLDPACSSIVNHLDKYLVSKYFKGADAGALIVFSSLIGLIVSPIIAVINPAIFSITPLHAVIFILNSIPYVTYIILYFRALSKDEASIVAPLFQTKFIFGLILGYLFLGETVTGQQLLAASIVAFGAILLSLDLHTKKIKVKKDVLLLMLASSFCLAINGVIFKIFALQEDFWISTFWTNIGLGLMGIWFLVFIKGYRKQFMFVMQKNKIPVIGLNALNEIIYIVGFIALSFASLLAPLGLVWIVSGFQPLFVFLFGTLLTIFFPHLGAENIDKKHLMQKFIAISIILVGTYLLNS